MMNAERPPHYTLEVSFWLLERLRFLIPIYMQDQPHELLTAEYAS